MPADLIPIDNIEGLMKLISPYLQDLWLDHYSSTQKKKNDSPPRWDNGEVYCPTCTDRRRVSTCLIGEVNITYSLWTHQTKKESYDEESYQHCLAKSPPNLFLLECLQCKNRFSAIVHASPGEVGVSLALFPHVGGGIATPNTPPSVSYFLDQAYKAQSGGATTAAVVMYRAALEQILKNQDFKGDTVGRLLADLRRKIDINQAPKWAVDLNPAFMQVINDLGNEVHLNSEDQNTLNVYNEKLLAKVQITFHELLNEIYERPEKLKARLTDLQSAQIIASTPSTVSSQR